MLHDHADHSDEWPRRLDGEVVTVTGGGRGLGRAVVHQFAREHCKIAIIDRDPDRAAMVKNEAESLGATAIAIAADVTFPEQVALSVDQVERALGPTTIMVSNVGGNIRQTILNLDVADWDDVLNSTLRPAFLYSRATIPGMLKTGRGRFFFIGSILGATPKAGSPAYSAAKAGLNSFAESMRIEFAPLGIQVTTVVPGAIDTPWFDDRLDVDRNTLLDPEQIGWMIVQIAKLTPRACIPEITFRPRKEVPPQPEFVSIMSESSPEI